MPPPCRLRSLTYLADPTLHEKDGNGDVAMLIDSASSQTLEEGPPPLSQEHPPLFSAFHLVWNSPRLPLGAPLKPLNCRS